MNKQSFVNVLTIKETLFVQKMFYGRIDLKFVCHIVIEETIKHVVNTE